MAKETLNERLLNDVLSDNTGRFQGNQCRNCKFMSDGTVHTCRPFKCHCQIFEWPNHRKPSNILDDVVECPFREAKDGN